MAQVTVASFLESKPNITTSTAADKLNSSLEGLDITLSQLTLSGLNELASKLHIPASQLSNMTLVQLTSYLSNFIKNSTSNNNSKPEVNSNDVEPTFKADFAANFNNLNFNSTPDNYDRYAVFRELLQEEIKQTKIDTEPQELQEEKENVDESDEKINNTEVQPIKESKEVVDKYAALREILENEIKQIENNGPVEEEKEEPVEPDAVILEKNNINEQDTFDENLENDISTNSEKKLIDEESNKDIISSKDVIEYSTPLDIKKDGKAITPTESSVNTQPVENQVPIAIESVQNNSRLNSGSLSDVISGSSPEVDNTGSASEVAKKTDAAGN